MQHNKISFKSLYSFLAHFQHCAVPVESSSSVRLNASNNLRLADRISVKFDIAVLSQYLSTHSNFVRDRSTITCNLHDLHDFSCENNWVGESPAGEFPRRDLKNLPCNHVGDSSVMTLSPSQATFHAHVVVSRNA